MKTKITISALVIALMLTGCAAPGLGSGDFQRSETRQIMTVKYGVIDAVRAVKLGDTSGKTGALAGAAVGGVAGSALGGGDPKTAIIGGILGIVGGGLAGNAIQGQGEKAQGVELTVRLDADTEQPLSVPASRVRDPRTGREIQQQQVSTKMRPFVFAVVQGLDPEEPAFKIGDRVRVLSSQTGIRVAH